MSPTFARTIDEKDSHLHASAVGRMVVEGL